MNFLISHIYTIPSFVHLSSCIVITRSRCTTFYKLNVIFNITISSSCRHFTPSPHECYHCYRSSVVSLYYLDIHIYIDIPTYPSQRTLHDTTPPTPLPPNSHNSHSHTLISHPKYTNNISPTYIHTYIHTYIPPFSPFSLPLTPIPTTTIRWVDV